MHSAVWAIEYPDGISMGRDEVCTEHGSAVPVELLRPPGGVLGDAGFDEGGAVGVHRFVEAAARSFGSLKSLRPKVSIILSYRAVDQRVRVHVQHRVRRDGSRARPRR
jgi:hypothetical protein